MGALEDLVEKGLDKKVSIILDAIKEIPKLNQTDPLIKEVGDRVSARLPLTKSQLCVYLGCDFSKIDRMVKNKEITCWHNGRRGDLRFSFEVYSSIKTKYLRRAND